MAPAPDKSSRKRPASIKATGKLAAGKTKAAVPDVELRSRAEQLQRRSKALQEKADHAQQHARKARREAQQAPHLKRLPPENPEARDEGPRLIPLPGPDFNRRELGIPSLPTDGYVTLADKAMKMWDKPPRKKKNKGA